MSTAAGCPLPLTNVIRAEEAEKLKDKVKSVRGLQLLPIYIRSYPEKEIAGHIIGYVGSKTANRPHQPHGSAVGAGGRPCGAGKGNSTKI